MSSYRASFTSNEEKIANLDADRCPTGILRSNAHADNAHVRVIVQSINADRQFGRDPAGINPSGSLTRVDQFAFNRVPRR